MKKIFYKIENFFRCSYINIRFPFYKHNHIFSIYSTYYSIPKGWRKEFGIQFSKELKRVIKDYHLIYFKLYSIKEKYGGISCDYYGGNNLLDTVIFKYEYISEHTCIKCGRTAEYVSTNGWKLPYCRKCIKDIITYEPFDEWYGYKIYKKDEK